MTLCIPLHFLPPTVTVRMAATHAGLSNPLGSPREFGSPRTPRGSRVTNVFEAGKPPTPRESTTKELQGPPPQLLHTLRAPDSPQTRESLWNPLHEPSDADHTADYFDNAVGGAPNSVKEAGFGRIK